MINTTLSITTYKKPKALEGTLNSVDNIGKITNIVIADDNDGECEEIANKYNKLHKNGDFIAPIVYVSGKNKGISVNKNRCIKEYLENNKDDILIMADDDIVYTKNPLRELKPDIKEFGELYLLDQLIAAHKFTKMPHITGFLEDYLDPGTDMEWVTLKPKIGENEYVFYYEMSQGLFLSFTRKAIEAAKYFPVMPYRYGYEHALYSSAVLKLYGYHPQTYPILKNCRRYFKCQGIGNNYEVDKDGLEKNNTAYKKRIEEIYKGLYLSNGVSGI